MIFINHFGTIVTILVFVYTFSLYVLFCVLQGRCFIVYVLSWILLTVQLFRICYLLRTVYPWHTPMWLTGFKTPIKLTQNCHNESCSHASNCPEPRCLTKRVVLRKQNKNKKKGLTMGFESSTAHVFGLHKVRRVWWAASVHRCQLAGHWSVRGWWQVSWISLWWPSSVYPHTFCVLYQQSTTAWYFCVCVCVCSNIVWNQNLGNLEWCFLQKSRSIFPLRCRFSVFIKLAAMATTVLRSVLYHLAVNRQKTLMDCFGEKCVHLHFVKM